MKFIMYCRNTDQPDQEPWKEPEDRPLKPFPETAEGAEAWAKQCLANFNATLRPGERHRTLVRVEVVAEGTSLHQWRKVSLVTEKGGYDRMECEVCRITGKRYGLGQSGVKVDAKFRAKKYQNCKAWED
jgi:hypothetical protein